MHPEQLPDLDQEFIDNLTKKIIDIDIDEKHKENLKEQIALVVGDHGRDKVMLHGLQMMKEEDKIVLALADPPSIGIHEMERTAPKLDPAPLLFANPYFLQEQEKAREREIERIEREARITQRRRVQENLHRIVQEDNCIQALNIIQNAGKRLRWTQVSTRLNPITLKGVKTFLRSHPNIVFTKNGKRQFVEWKD
jgi:hypothetical protein